MRFGAFVCHWCDSTEHRASPLRLDLTRAAFVHDACRRSDADLRRIVSVRTSDGMQHVGKMLVALQHNAERRGKVTEVEVSRALS